MAEPISTATGIAVGGWFAAKVFGASAERLGENLLAYLEGRVPHIFSKAEAIAREEGIQPKPIKPGLLARLIIDASMSDENDEITEWWANLVLEASIAGSNRHAVFSDMMAAVGPREAIFLQKFYAMVSEKRPKGEKPWTFSRFIVEHFVGEFASDISWMFPLNSETVERASNAMMNFRGDMPAKAIAWGLPSQVTVQIGYDPCDLVLRGERRASWFEGCEVEFEILERAQILRMSRHEMPTSEGPSGWVQFIEFTQLGMAFYESCTGISRKWEVRV